MSVSNSADGRRAPYSGLRGLVASHPVVAFLVLAFGFGWISLIPILLAENGFGVLSAELPLTVVQTIATVLGLALPAFLVTAATGGKEAMRDLLGRLLRWRVGRRLARGDRFARRSTARGVSRGTGGCCSPRSCPASSCPSCTPTCGRSSDGRVFCSQRCRTAAGPCLRA
jgi:hypothetical protein